MQRFLSTKLWVSGLPHCHFRAQVPSKGFLGRFIWLMHSLKFTHELQWEWVMSQMNALCGIILFSMEHGHWPSSAEQAGAWQCLDNLQKLTQNISTVHQYWHFLTVIRRKRVLTAEMAQTDFQNGRADLFISVVCQLFQWKKLWLKKGSSGDMDSATNLWLMSTLLGQVTKLPEGQDEVCCHLANMHWHTEQPMKEHTLTGWPSWTQSTCHGAAIMWVFHWWEASTSKFCMNASSFCHLELFLLIIDDTDKIP